MALRKYSSYDLIRFKKFAEANPTLKNLELIKAYNLEYPELTAKQQLINVYNGLDMKLPKWLRN